MEVLAKTVVVIILQYINISNQHTAHFKLTMLHVNLKKVGRKKGVPDSVAILSQEFSPFTLETEGVTMLAVCPSQ